MYNTLLMNLIFCSVKILKQNNITMGISVIMSVYKAESSDNLDKALNSIWTNQSYKPNEIILIEDGPLTDDLYIVIQKWNKELGESLVIIKNEQNIGLTKSLNKGIAIAKNTFIARMDSDDISHPLRFEKQISFLKSNEEISVVGGAIQEFNRENECLNIRHYPKTNDDILSYIYKASPLAHPAVMIRKEIFDNGLTYNERYKTSQDLALWYDVLCKGYKIANIEDIVLYFRREDGVYKRRGKDKAVNEFKIYINGISRLYGVVTWRYIFPLARLVARLMPTTIVKFLYNSKARKYLLNK